MVELKLKSEPIEPKEETGCETTIKSAEILDGEYVAGAKRECDDGGESKSIAFGNSRKQAENGALEKVREETGESSLFQKISSPDEIEAGLPVLKAKWKTNQEE